MEITGREERREAEAELDEAPVDLICVGAEGADTGPDPADVVPLWEEACSGAGRPETGEGGESETVVVGRGGVSGGMVMVAEMSAEPNFPIGLPMIELVRNLVEKSPSWKRFQSILNSWPVMLKTSLESLV